MKFPIAIEPGTATTAWGVVVSDLPTAQSLTHWQAMPEYIGGCGP